MAFYLKKIIAPFLFPPGVFILLLFISVFWLFMKGLKKAGLFNLLIALLIWLCSICPVSNALMRGVEHAYSIPSHPKGDVIVLLGGGSNMDAPDLSGKGFPNGEMLGRVVAAARLQQRLNIPVIVSSGQVYPDSPSEAPVIKRILTDLKAPAGMIILEQKSRDTRENALYTREICEKWGFRNIILITSAYHMQRSVFIFQEAGLTVTPFPAAFHTSEEPVDYGWMDYLPNAGSLMDSYAALHEYMGILFYAIAC